MVELERSLDQAFADRTMTEERLADLLEAIAGKRAQLRAAHLRAHLRVMPLLEDSQREQYLRARGYVR